MDPTYGGCVQSLLCVGRTARPNSSHEITYRVALFTCFMVLMRALDPQNDFQGAWRWWCPMALEFVVTILLVVAWHGSS